MSALLQARRALGEEIAGLGRSLDDARREVLERLATEAADLRGDSRETRDRVDRGAAAAAETGRAVSQLRQELADVRQSIAGLRESLDALARHPAFRTEPADHRDPPGAGDGDGERQGEDAAWAETDAEADAEAGAGSDAVPVDAGQEPPFPPLGDGDEDDEGDEDGFHQDADDEADGEPHGDSASAPADYPAHACIRRETQEDVDHGVLLLKAAQTGSVALVCHRETWQFLVVCAADNEHFHAACELADEGDGRVRAVLSGRSVIGALIALRQTRDDRHLDGTWALASAFYSRIAEGLRTTGRDGRHPLTVVFDDGVSDAPPDAAKSPRNPAA
ncbi:hypothetical protein [Streptomyces sp. NPDC059788]|uniref:hypothetical protein n=1 Tax=Streptomyces sp. NPDC059788 TaxID=3346948 RepID=UPI003646DB5D